MTGDRKERPLVSVIVNCHNGERYLREALDSIYGQTYPCWEIIFWDNASIDDSANIARQYDKRLRYFSVDNLTTLGAARAEAVKRSAGELLAFLDTDDVFLPDALERQVESILSSGCAVSYGGFSMIDEKGEEVGRWVPPKREGDVLEAFLCQWEIAVPAVVVRRSALERHGLNFDPRMTASEEYCLFMQLAAEEPFRSIDVPLAKYRVHSDALTNRTTSVWADEREYTLDRLLARRRDLRELYPVAIKEAYSRAGYYRARYHAAMGDRKRARRALRPAVRVHWRYAALYLLLYGPLRLWNFVHSVTGRRTSLS
ncbi:MAG: glycosyltransferase family 2 protein [Candidatus Binatia bacterium]